MGRIIKEGIKTAIVGKPNAGKSTLMNLLSGEEKSIVTMTPGTTRDVITETIEVDGILLNIADTAGIRESGDEIEKIGIARALERLMDSDLVIAVFDTSIPLDENDYAVLEKIHGKNVVGVINKCDLENKLETELILREIPDAIFISAIDDGGIKDLKKLIKKKTTGDFDYQNDDVITSLRQKEKLFRAMECVDNALNSIYDGFTPDITGIDLEDAVRAFGELTGETVGEQVVDSIFHRFCLGK